jgi:hypothetical protein
VKEKMIGIDILETKKNFRQLFQKHSVTTRQIMELCGFTSRTPVYKWLSLKDKSLPSLDHIILLSRYLGVSVETIIRMTDD